MPALTKPVIIDPGKLDGAAILPAPETPVTFTWADVDPNTDSVELTVTSLDSPMDGYGFRYTGMTPFLTRRAGPLYFSEGAWEAHMAVSCQKDFVNADGVTYSCVREAASSYRFQAYDECDIQMDYVHEFDHGIYAMGMEAITDRSVTRVQVRCPSGKIIEIVEYEVNDDDTLTWEYEDDASFPLLSTYGDGNYVFTFSYSNGTSWSTTVPFAQADGTTPIPDIRVQPRITSPPWLDGRTFSTHNLTLEWGSIDPGANRVTLDREWNDGDDENFHYSDAFIFPNRRGPLETQSDSFFFDVGKWEIDVESFHSVIGRNADGIRYIVQKKGYSDYEFHVF
jgi:hypothetical protein